MFPRWLNITLQSIMTAGQVYNQVGGLLPPKYQVATTTILSSAQLVIGVIAHNYNPDGSAATEPYRPPATPGKF